MIKTKLLHPILTLQAFLSQSFGCSHSVHIGSKARIRRPSTHVQNLTDELSDAKEWCLN